MDVVRYDPTKEQTWNGFRTQSINGTFMFDRSYMDYHSDLTEMFDERFVDHSLLFYDNSSLVAILPANERNNSLVSHEGLTFGGLLIPKDLKTPKLLRIFEALRTYLRDCDLERIDYKCIPHIYHDFPASADRYALFRNDAELYRRDISSVIPVTGEHKFPRRRRRELNKANDTGLQVERTDKLDAFWEVLQDNLEREHGTTPVHSVSEMEYLKENFPKNIELFGCFHNGRMLSGALMYESSRTARLQYLATTVEGMDLGSNEKIVDFLLNEYYSSDDVSYLDFGISTEDEGRLLNEGLITFKESFDAHPTVHDFYRLQA